MKFVFSIWFLLFSITCIRNNRPLNLPPKLSSNHSEDFRTEMKVTQIQNIRNQESTSKPIYKDGREVIATSREFEPDPALLGIELEEEDSESNENPPHSPAKKMKELRSNQAWTYSCTFLHPDCTKGCKRNLNISGKYARTSNSDRLAECVQNCNSNCESYFERLKSGRRSTRR